jgi:D-3-phosphoglycerate dehydrogenase / 2-oxoglutarate reductase
MSSRKVLVTDYTWASTAPEAAVLAQADAELLVAETGAEEELLALVPDADAILTCFQKVTPDVVRAGTKLQVIGRYGIGVDNIAVAEATSRGIPVTNVPAYCLDEVAEHALAFVLAFARGLHVYNPAVREGDWSLGRGAPMYRVSGRTLGILGYGKIGRSLAGKAQGLGLRILTYAPTQTAGAVRSAGAEPVELDELARESDFLSVHLPLTAETRGLVGEELLRSMKPTAFVVNTARGGIVDQDALLRALADGWIAGAAVDVFEPEHLPADHPLLAQPNLIATPHVAFYSEESVHDLEVLAAENVAAILTGRRPRWLVNPEVLERPQWSHLT